MSVGLPGTGVGSAFYLLGAIWSPMRAAFRRHGATRLRRSVAVAGIALGVIAAVLGATLALGLFLPQANPRVLSIPVGDAGDGAGLPVSFWIVLLLLSPAGTLVFVILMMHAVRLIAVRSTTGGVVTFEGHDQLAVGPHEANPSADIVVASAEASGRAR